MSRFSDQFMAQEINAKCPGCGASYKVTLKQVRDRARVTCPGCRKQIQIQPEGDDLRRIEKALDDFQKTLKEFGKGR